MKRAKLDLRPRATARLDATHDAGADSPPTAVVKPDAAPTPPAARPRHAGTPAARPRSREGTKALTFHVPRAVAKRFAQLALDLERSHQALGEEALADLFAKYKAP
jgi:hypothetical protein